MRNAVIKYPRTEYGDAKLCNPVDIETYLSTIRVSPSVKV